MNRQTAHVDRFVLDRLPPRSEWPEFLFKLPSLAYPQRLNCAAELLDRNAARHPDAVAIRTADGDWTYAQLRDRVDRLCHVLTVDLAVQPGNRVLLRAANSVMLIAAWLAVVKVGAIAVATMPMLRARELATILTKARISHALCELRLAGELEDAQASAECLKRMVKWGDGELDKLLERHPGSFTAVDTAQDDPCILAFTSGTTGEPKATIHFHRDVLAMADTFAAHMLHPVPQDVFAGTPPLAFTYGLGAELVFPFRFGASTAVLGGSTPDSVLEGVARFGITRLFTAPTAYRGMLAQSSLPDMSAVRSFVSAGEHLPLATFENWHTATGHRIIDGIGATEMIHIFISAARENIRPGSTGQAVPGYLACILDPDGRPAAKGTPGKLAVKGPTGCRYLSDERQKQYVVNGWNITGDTYVMDEDGYFWFQCRTDDMIVSAGYNIAALEVEAALLEHPAVTDCAVVGVPDPLRGQVVKAYVVTSCEQSEPEALAAALQDFVKQTIAPYKYPRLIEFVASLPTTPTGKLQRFKLRQRPH